MDYTSSDAYIVDVASGRRRHQDTAPLATLVSADDMNRIMWSLMEFVKDAGLSGLSFDALTPATYRVLRTAMDAHYAMRWNIKKFGITSTGNQIVKYQQAVNELSAIGGGIVSVPGGVNSVLDGILNVPDNVVLEYEGGLPGHINPVSMLARAGKLHMTEGSKIIINNGAGLRNFILIKDGMNFAQSSVEATGWTGTAVELKNATSDHLVEGCAILGFNTAISTAAAATNVSRTRLHRLQIDCTNGVFLEKAFDIPYLNQLHCWPFLSIGAALETNGAHLLRSGVAYKFGEVNDWLDASSLFNYGYQLGFHLAGADNVTLMACKSDYVPDIPAASNTSIGCLIDGDCSEPTLIAFQTAARKNGIHHNSTATNSDLTVLGGNSWEIDSNHLLLERGRALVQGFKMRSSGVAGTGIRVESTYDKATLLGNHFKNLAVGISQASNATKVYKAMNAFDGVATRHVNPYKPTITAVDPLILDGESHFFEVIGNTAFGTIGHPEDYAGKTVVLKFLGTPQLTDGGVNTKLNGNFNPNADDTITLLSDGTSWFEQARSAN